MLKSIRNAEKEKEREDIWLIKSSKWRARVILIERRPFPFFQTDPISDMKNNSFGDYFRLGTILNLESFKNIEKIAPVIRWIITADLNRWRLKYSVSVENILALSRHKWSRGRGRGRKGNRDRPVIRAGRANKRDPQTRSSTHELESGAGEVGRN